MNIVLFMIPIALFLGLGFLAAFLWANRNGQFDDLSGPAHRMLFEDDLTNNKTADSAAKRRTIE